MLERSASLGRTRSGGGGGRIEDGWEKERDEGNSSSHSIWTESFKKCSCGVGTLLQRVGDMDEGWRVVGHCENL